MGLFTSLYLTMVNAISGNVLAQRANSTRADIRVVEAQNSDEMVWVLEDELSNAINPVDRAGGPVMVLPFLESQIATTYETIETVRESPAIETARLLVWLMRAMKPDKSPGAQANDRSRVRAFCQQLQIHITVPDFPAGTQELLNSAYNFVVNNHGPLVLGALRVTAVRGEVMVAKVATIYLQLIHKSHEFGFRFTYAVIVSTHKDVMSHKAMRQSTLAFHQFLRDYVEIAESTEAQGDAGWYAYLRTLHNKHRMSFSDLARECKVLYALADRIQQATVKHDDTKVWMGFKDARKEIDELLVEELYTQWVAGEEADDGVLQSLYG